MSGPLGIAFDPAKLKQATAKEYLLRFAFGGSVTLVTGVIAHSFGPLVGGLFLGFSRHPAGQRDAAARSRESPEGGRRRVGRGGG